MYPLLLILMAVALLIMLCIKRMSRYDDIYPTVRSWLWMLMVLWMVFMMGRLSVAVLGVLMAVIGAWELWRVVSIWTWRDVIFLGLIVSFGVSWAWLSLMAEPLSVLLFVLFLVQFNDVCQYVMGRLLGRRFFVVRLAPNVSPNKTIEGAIFGVLLMTVIVFPIGRMMTGFGGIQLVMMCILLGVCGIIGDLIESSIKRRHHVKDMGSWLAGHGGMLDRMDSLLVSVPLFAILMTVL